MKILLCIYNLSKNTDKKISSFEQFCEDIGEKCSLTILEPIRGKSSDKNSYFKNIASSIDVKGINLFIDTYSYFKKSSLDYALKEKYSHCIFFDNENINKTSLTSYLTDHQSQSDQNKQDVVAPKNRWSRLISSFVGNKFTHLFTKEIVAIPLTSIAKIPYHLLNNGSKFDIELAFQLSLLNVEPEAIVFTADASKSVNIRKFFTFLLEWMKLYISNRGLVFQPKYDVEITNSHYPLKLGYASSHTMALDALKGATSILDIGSGPKPISYELQDKSIDILTVDMHPPSEKKPYYNHKNQDLNLPLEIDISRYQSILLLDIIEHLQNPELFLKNLTAQFKTDEHKIICTTGNIAFLPMRITLLLGKFNYGKRGILDRTHTRLYTFFTFRDLIARSGMTVTKIKGIPVPFPLAFGDNSFSRFLVKLNEFLMFFSKSIFSFQIYIEAKSQPSFHSQVVDVDMDIK